MVRASKDSTLDRMSVKALRERVKRLEAERKACIPKCDLGRQTRAAMEKKRTENFIEMKLARQKQK